MFYISLPYFYENSQFNQFFQNYIEDNRLRQQSKLIANFNIEYIYGAFPWSYWNGGINNHYGAAVFADNMNTIFTKTLTPIRVDMSNIFIKQYDYYDIHENTILKMANGTNTVYEISDLNLMEYISEYNLNNKFIISNNFQLIQNFNSDIINLMQDSEEIDLINIDYNTYNLLQNNINSNKLEISIGYCQNCSFEKQLFCSENEQKNIYNFSKQSCFINCPNEYKINNYYNIIKPYLKKGIKHFKIITGPNNLKDFNIKIIKSFVKPEYQGECINEYYRRISK